VKDVVDGTMRVVPVSELGDGSQITTLRGYEYSFYEIRPAASAALAGTTR
jgi:hypothetical protein